MYKVFTIPGNFFNAHFWKHPWSPADTDITAQPLKDPKNPESDLLTIDAAFTWNAYVGGNWKEKWDLNMVQANNGTQPKLAKEFRTSTMRRVFFGAWESYFLIAEAAEYGWKVPMGGKAAYEKGIRESFAYWDKAIADASYNVSDFVDAYIADDTYSRVGTSVAWDHTAEPAASVTMRRVNGYSGAAETFAYNYPVNNLYRDGSVRNDHLTKIITQKYIANIPWLPLEAWSDHRRLGLPFFENPAVEDKIEALPGLTQTNYMQASWANFPQRVKYPTSLANNVPDGYKQATSLLSGPDDLWTPFFWAKAATK